MFECVCVCVCDRERERERSLVTIPGRRYKSVLFQATRDMWSPMKWKLGSIIFISLAPVKVWASSWSPMQK